MVLGKTRTLWGPISTFGEVTAEKMVGGGEGLWGWCCSFPILNLVTSCFYIKSYFSYSLNCFAKRIWGFSYSIKLHVNSASHSNISYILHILQIDSPEKFQFLVKVFNLRHDYIFITTNQNTDFRNWLLLTKHFCLCRIRHS